MARYLKVAAAQLGPIHLKDDRASVVGRLVAMLREAAGAGARLVVFPELALTTFFPRYWYDVREIDAWFERAMPNAATQPLFDLAAELQVGFNLGYAERGRGRFLARPAGAAACPSGVLAPEMDPARNFGAELL